MKGILYSEKGEVDREFSCEGVFEEIGQMPATEFVNDFVKLNERGEIITDRRCQTFVSGIFAAGDVTDDPHKQIIVATGQGAIAALEAHEYLMKHET